METVKTVVEMAYREITKLGFFDIVKGNEPIEPALNKPMADIPQIMSDYVKDCGFGCCFVFSAYMLKILEQFDINAYMVVSIEDKGLRASVMYQDGEAFYIANPVEDIEYFTIENIKPEERYKYYIADSATMVIDGKAHDDSRFTIEDFSNRYGQVWVLGKMNKESNETLSCAIKDKSNNCIAPEENANVEIKKYMNK